MTLSEISIRRPVLAWMLMAALIVFGGIAFVRMGISQYPDVDYPVVSINVRLEGAAPEIIETSVADVIENAVMGVAGIRDITSESETSEGTITVEFELGRDIDSAVQDIQARVDSVLQKLPKGITSPRIRKSNPNDVPVMTLTLSSAKASLPTLMEYVSSRVRDQFTTVDGVGDIGLGGYRDPNLRLWVSAKSLKAYALTVNDLIATIQSEHVESAAGDMVNQAVRYNVRTVGELTKPEDFGNLLISQRGGQTNYARIHIRQVARVEEGMADPTGYSRADGVPAVSLDIMKQPGANAVEVAQAVRAKVAAVQAGLPAGMTLRIAYDGSRYIQQAVHELDFTLVLSAILTALVCWLFLGSWSSTLNVILAIPTSVVGTFIVLYFAGFTLNTFTLLGLSLSIGIVVDDAIMVLENIVRHREMGKSRYGAALAGSREIGFAALVATLSLIAIFLPVAFISGVIGRFFFQFGVTITVAVLLSLLEALTLTPMRCAQFLDMEPRKSRLGRGMEALMDWASRRYSTTLAWALRHRGAVLLGALAIFAITSTSAFFINKEFVPTEDQSRFMVRYKLPIGTSLSRSDEVSRPIEAWIRARPEVDGEVMVVGGGSPGDSNHGRALVTMKERGQRGVDKVAGHELSQEELMQVCRDALKKMGVKASVQGLGSRVFTGSRGFPVEFTLRGPEWDKLADYADQFSAALEKTGLVTDLDSNYDVGQPELRIIPDRAQATRHAVSVASIAQTIDAMIGGTVVGAYEKGGHRYDIRLKMDNAPGDPQDKLDSLFVRNSRGELIPLKSLVTLSKGAGLVSIWRNNRERAITLGVNLAPGVSQQVVMDQVQAMGKKLLPSDYHITFSGGARSFGESFRSLMLVFALGVLVSYMVLGSQFNSFFDPLSVLMALPFSVSGALLALWAFHQSINIYSIIGLILLMGIVKKNSILLVDFSNQVRAGQKRKDVHKALLQACPIRLRPILMTSVATLVGALPAALALGPGAETRMPMALAIIGGVLFSTPLTLYVVPCFYSFMARFEDRASHELALEKGMREDETDRNKPLSAH